MNEFYYVNKAIPGSFIDYNEELDQDYWEGKIGYTYEDYENNKWVLLTEEQANFHLQNPEASVKEVFECDRLSYAKKRKISEIDEYDASDSVNCFYLGGQPMWLTYSEREQLATQISAHEAVGRDTMTRWFSGHEYTFPIAVWKQMLLALEIYAGDTLNVTESHKAAVGAMDDADKVIAYDFTVGYPDKLVFPYPVQQTYE